MKLPSLNYLAQHARQAFLRFPLAILSAFIAACIGIYLTEYNDQVVNAFPYINVMLCAALGIPLFFCIAVFSFNKGYNLTKRIVFYVLGLVILGLIYFTLPDKESTQNTSLPYIRYGLYAIIIHLLVAFIPFISVGQLNGFWHYNKILFVRFLTSLLYSGFLYAGLALALGSLDFLFDIDLHSELFLDLFILIAGLFNTWFFVAGIPTTFHALDEINSYPKGIKIFSQYVLLPLLILYLIILYIYAGKIVVLWSWPKGLVSYLIACVAVLGILTLLLIYPYGNLSGNGWIRKFSKTYYFILLPLVVLLFIAIGMRVADYGITINRYVIILLGAWLTIVCAYFIVGKANIKFIPISLTLILLLVSFGYWGMFSVSERSQIKRLKAILEENKILQYGTVNREVLWIQDSLPRLLAVKDENVNESMLSDSLHNEVKSILDYLDDYHGFESIKAWFKQDIDWMVMASDTVKERWQRLNEAEAYMRSMGLEYEFRYSSLTENSYNYHAKYEDSKVIDVRGYDYFVQFQGSFYDGAALRINSTKYTVSYTWNPSVKLILSAQNKDTVIFEVGDLINKLRVKYPDAYRADIPQAEMLLHGTSNRMDAKFEVQSMSIYSDNDSLKVSSLSGNLLIRNKIE